MEGQPAIDPRQVGRNVVMTSAIAGLGGLLFGYDTGVIAGALLFITPDFGLTSFESGLVVGAVPIGAVLGAGLAGRLSDEYGRRLLILISAVVFVVGSLVCAAAPDTAVLVVARAVLGAAIGLASATAPVYISEVAPPDIRGRLVTFFQLAVMSGSSSPTWSGSHSTPARAGAGCSASARCPRSRSGSGCCACPRARAGW